MKVLDMLVQKQSEQSKNAQELVELVNFTENLLEQEHLQPTEIQWKILVNHLDEMIRRSKTGEKLPEMDINLFSDLSKKSMKMAEKVVQSVQNLEDNEQFLLAVHFENIQGNIF